MNRFPNDQEILNKGLSTFLKIFEASLTSDMKKGVARNTVDYIIDVLLKHGSTIDSTNLNETLKYNPASNKDESVPFNIDRMNFDKKVNFLVRNGVLQEKHKPAVLFVWNEGYYGAHTHIKTIFNEELYADALTICLFPILDWFYQSFTFVDEPNKQLKLNIDKKFSEHFNTSTSLNEPKVSRLRLFLSFIAGVIVTSILLSFIYKSFSNDSNELQLDSQILHDTIWITKFSEADSLTQHYLNLSKENEKNTQGGGIELNNYGGGTIDKVTNIEKANDVTIN